MNDLTKGPVLRHLITLSAFLAFSMVFQTLYYLADLYFVGRLGKDAIAGVSLGGNLMLVVLALTQTLGVGTTALISHAAGQKNQPRAQLIFNQAFILSLIVGLVFSVAAFLLRSQYCRWLGADGETATLGAQYLLWFVPAMFLQFSLIAMTSALRGTGVVKAPVMIQITTVLLNVLLAPILILGWLTGRPLGVQGAALATLIAVFCGTVALFGYFLRPSSYLKFKTNEWRPIADIWRGMIKIGVPAGAEFGLMSIYMVLIYWIIRNFGSAAQAGFGIAVRLMQSMFLPVLSIGFAVAPVCGQNFGARNAERVRETFKSAALLCSILMFALTMFCQFMSPVLMGIFSRDAAVIALGADYLRIISWNFVAMGLIFSSSSMFQGMGNTLPALVSSSLRLLLFALPAFVVSFRPGFQIRQVWYLSVASVTIQAVINLLLLRREYGRKLVFAAPAAEIAPASAALA